MTTGELSRAALPVSLSTRVNRVNTTGMLFAQGSMLQLEQAFFDYSPYDAGLSNCPSLEVGGVSDDCRLYLSNDCPFVPHSRLSEGKSMLGTIGMLCALSLIYLLMAAYWGIVHVGGPGSYPFYFPFMQGYWLGAKKKTNKVSEIRDAVDVEEAVTQHNASATENGCDVTVENVFKTYGSVEAVSGISLQMTRGEVTAILGHNGAGK